MLTATSAFVLSALVLSQQTEHAPAAVNDRGTGGGDTKPVRPQHGLGDIDDVRHGQQGLCVTLLDSMARHNAYTDLLPARATPRPGPAVVTCHTSAITVAPRTMTKSAAVGAGAVRTGAAQPPAIQGNLAAAAGERESLQVLVRSPVNRTVAVSVNFSGVTCQGRGIDPGSVRAERLGFVYASNVRTHALWPDLADLASVTCTCTIWEFARRQCGLPHDWQCML